MHRLSDPFSSPQRLTQSVVQVGALLGLHRAEVGRVLGFRCEQFSAMFNGRLILEPGTEAWRQGELFVRLFQALFDYCGGDEPRMINWLRRDNPAFGNAPFYLMVDEGRLDEIVDWLEQR